MSNLRPDPDTRARLALEREHQFPSDLYRTIADARAGTIEQLLRETPTRPEPPAETLALAAAALAHVAHLRPGRDAPAAALAAQLAAVARELDPFVAVLTEHWYAELDRGDPVAIAEILKEVADSLAWAAATLRCLADDLVGADEGNVGELELAWLCLAEAADLFLAADRAALRGLGVEV